MQKTKLREDKNMTEEKSAKLFEKYQEAAERIKLVEWAKEEIKKKPEKIIVVKIVDLAKEMGPDFLKIKYKSLFSALRYILFHNGLNITMGTHKDGDKVFVIREKIDNERLPQSYIELEKKAHKEIEKKDLTKNRKKEKTIDRSENIKREREEMLEEIRHKKIKMLEEIEQERRLIHKEKAVMQKEIYELKKVLNKNFDDNVFLVEIFQFNWKTFTWKLVRRKGIKAYDVLFRLIKEYNSSNDNRYRFEFTTIRRGTIEEVEIDENKIDKIDETPLDDKNLLNKLDEDIKPEEKEGKILKCPRCGGNNISTFGTEEIIKTRTVEKKLRYRCRDCNELFGDADLR